MSSTNEYRRRDVCSMELVRRVWRCLNTNALVYGWCLFWLLIPAPLYSTPLLPGTLSKCLCTIGYYPTGLLFKTDNLFEMSPSEIRFLTMDILDMKMTNISAHLTVCWAAITLIVGIWCLVGRLIAFANWRRMHMNSRDQEPLDLGWLFI